MQNTLFPGKRDAFVAEEACLLPSRSRRLRGKFSVFPGGRRGARRNYRWIKGKLTKVAPVGYTSRDVCTAGGGDSRGKRHCKVLATAFAALGVVKEWKEGGRGVKLSCQQHSTLVTSAFAPGPTGGSDGGIKKYKKRPETDEGGRPREKKKVTRKTQKESVFLFSLFGPGEEKRALAHFLMFRAANLSRCPRAEGGSVKKPKRKMPFSLSARRPITMIGFLTGVTFKGAAHLCVEVLDYLKELSLSGCRLGEMASFDDVEIRSSSLTRESNHRATESKEQFLNYPYPFDTKFAGAAVAEQLACSPPTEAIRAQSPAGSLRISASGKHGGRCRWSAGFPGDRPLLPPFHTGAAPYSPQSTLIGSEDLDDELTTAQAELQNQRRGRLGNAHAQEGGQDQRQKEKNKDGNTEVGPVEHGGTKIKVYRAAVGAGRAQVHELCAKHGESLTEPECAHDKCKHQHAAYPIHTATTNLSLSKSSISTPSLILTTNISIFPNTGVSTKFATSSANCHTTLPVNPTDNVTPSNQLCTTNCKQLATRERKVTETTAVISTPATGDTAKRNLSCFQILPIFAGSANEDPSAFIKDYTSLLKCYGVWEKDWASCVGAQVQGDIFSWWHSLNHYELS
ncbi:hypothetical protein PR048_031131 [Dryococelus australis]|uniref:Uncharacterized protein n=1 Tax=Dryococelus australis TaxID=614101 RepID=A0ABQ9G4E5_9NEOP|nr:hypothetical protein PR048_031131 [Dryococelus australis]